MSLEKGPERRQPQTLPDFLRERLDVMIVQQTGQLVKEAVGERIFSGPFTDMMMQLASLALKKDRFKREELQRQRREIMHNAKKARIHLDFVEAALSESEKLVEQWQEEQRKIRMVNQTYGFNTYMSPDRSNEGTDPINFLGDYQENTTEH